MYFLGESTTPVSTSISHQAQGVANINIANITGIPPNINIQNLTGLPGMNIANLQGLQNMQVCIVLIVSLFLFHYLPYLNKGDKGSGLVVEVSASRPRGFGF